MIFFAGADNARRAHAGGRRCEVDLRRQVGRAEDDVSAANVMARRGVNLIRADDDVGKAIAVHVAFVAPDAHAAFGLWAVDGGDARRWRQASQVDVAAEIRPAKDDIGRAGVKAIRPILQRRAGQDVAQAIVIDIAID